MTTEKQLREIAATAIREHLTGEPLNAVFEDVCCEQSLDPEHPDAQRIYDLIHDWPILDLPVPDRDGYWWPKAATIRTVSKTPRGEIRIQSGNFQQFQMYLTPEKALDIAAILTAAADYAERNRHEPE